MKIHEGTVPESPEEQTTKRWDEIKNRALAAYQNIEEQGGFFAYYTTATDRIHSKATELNNKRKKLYEDIQDYFMSLQAVQFGIGTVDKIQNSHVYRSTKNASVKAINTILDSAIFKLLTSRLFIRALTAITIIATSGPFLTLIGLTSIGIGAAVDTFQLGTTRRLKHEHTKLLQHLNAREKQAFLLDHIAPDLKTILANELKPQVAYQDAEKIRAKSHKISNVNWSIFSSAGNAILKTARSIINGVLRLMTAANVIQAAALASSFLFFLLEFRQQKSISVFNNQLREDINQQRQHHNSPIYQDRMELDELTRAQRVQTLALEKTICDLDVMKWIGKLKQPHLTESIKEAYNTKIKERYQANVKQVETRVKQVRNSRGIIANIRITGENFIKAHDPFSKYNDVSTVEKSLRSPSNLIIINNNFRERAKISTDIEPKQKQLDPVKTKESQVEKLQKKDNQSRTSIHGR